jgi:hypothetical protein
VRLKSLLGILDLNEAWKIEVGSSREYLKVFAMCIECPSLLSSSDHFLEQLDRYKFSHSLDLWKFYRWLKS